MLVKSLLTPNDLTPFIESGLINSPISVTSDVEELDERTQKTKLTTIVVGNL